MGLQRGHKHNWATKNTCNKNMIHMPICNLIVLINRGTDGIDELRICCVWLCRNLDHFNRRNTGLQCYRIIKRHGRSWGQPRKFTGFVAGFPAEGMASIQYLLFKGWWRKPEIPAWWSKAGRVCKTCSQHSVDGHVVSRWPPAAGLQRARRSQDSHSSLSEKQLLKARKSLGFGVSHPGL